MPFLMTNIYMIVLLSSVFIWVVHTTYIYTHTTQIFEPIDSFRLHNLSNFIDPFIYFFSFSRAVLRNQYICIAQCIDVPLYTNIYTNDFEYGLQRKRYYIKINTLTRNRYTSVPRWASERCCSHRSQQPYDCHFNLRA